VAGAAAGDIGGGGAAAAAAPGVDRVATHISVGMKKNKTVGPIVGSPNRGSYGQSGFCFF